jgi:hypothetical protein
MRFWLYGKFTRFQRYNVRNTTTNVRQWCKAKQTDGATNVGCANGVPRF